MPEQWQKDRCELCAVDRPVGVLYKRRIHLNELSVSWDKPCTAPTAEEYIEEQDVKIATMERTIAELRGALEPLVKPGLRLKPYDQMVGHARKVLAKTASSAIPAASETDQALPFLDGSELDGRTAR